jgi:hypothetical protein
MKGKFLSRIRRRSTGNTEGYFRRFFRGDGHLAEVSRQPAPSWKAVNVLFEEISRGSIQVLDRMQARIRAVKVYGKKTQINAVASQAEVQIHLYRLAPGTTLVAVDAVCLGEPANAMAEKVRERICRMASKGAEPVRPAEGGKRIHPPEPFVRILNRQLALSAAKEDAA